MYDDFRQFFKETFYEKTILLDRIIFLILTLNKIKLFFETVYKLNYLKKL